MNHPSYHFFLFLGGGSKMRSREREAGCQRRSHHEIRVRNRLRRRGTRWAECPGLGGATTRHMLRTSILHNQSFIRVARSPLPHICAAAGRAGGVGEHRALDRMRLSASSLARLGWGPAELAARRQGDPRKAMMAARLRPETTMRRSGITAPLRMGAPAHVAHLLYRQGRKMAACENTLF